MVVKQFFKLIIFYDVNYLLTFKWKIKLIKFFIIFVFLVKGEALVALEHGYNDLSGYLILLIFLIKIIVLY